MLGKIQDSGKYTYAGFSFDVSKFDDVHCLSDVFRDNQLMRRVFCRDIAIKDRAHDIMPGAEHQNFGAPLSRSSSCRFSFSNSMLTIFGEKTYSRRSENKTRIYPYEIVADRVEFFLKYCPFIESYCRRDIGLNVYFDVKFVPVRSPEGTIEYEISQFKRKVEWVETNITGVKRQIDNFVPIEKLVRLRDQYVHDRALLLEKIETLQNRQEGVSHVI
ncbi:MAG: hypothetical protein [Caudoviricetes sp.]|nr:MAG: hypothetical protein [Caudoviricetes sp.]